LASSAPETSSFPTEWWSTFAVILLLWAISSAPSFSEGRGGPKAIAPNGHDFRLEIANTPEERARGYMYRSRVGPEEGMLFIFPESDFHSFWMKNCLVSLDILWLSDELVVVHLEQKVPPCRKDPCQGYPPMSKARYVLEIGSGMAKKSGLRVGSKVRIEGIELEKTAETPRNSVQILVMHPGGPNFSTPACCSPRTGQLFVNQHIVRRLPRKWTHDGPVLSLTSPLMKA